MGKRMRTSDGVHRAAAGAAEIAAALVQSQRFVVPEGTPFPLLRLGDALVYRAITAQMA